MTPGLEHHHHHLACPHPNQAVRKQTRRTAGISDTAGAEQLLIDQQLSGGMSRLTRDPDVENGEASVLRTELHVTYF